MPGLELPIDAVLPEVLASLRANASLVLEAPPGAGKTTRVPIAMLQAGLAGDGEVWVLQPRRLAARLAASRVAEELGERPGETVGWQVRFEEVSGPRTRLRFMTEGVLSRRLLSDPQLARAGAVVLDEFHERHLDGDLALAMLRRLQRARPSLTLVVMSATLDAAPIAAWLGCPSIRSEGKRFEVGIEHAPADDARPLATQVAGAVKRLLAEGLDGDVLVFLPGAGEIRRAQEALSEVAARADLLVLPLHGELPPAEQDRAVKPAGKRKVILSTNVAETSVTIDGVVAVIDGGLARIASLAPWSGIPVLKTAKVSRSSAAQRAGRAGRTRPGRAIRLYTRHDHDTRPQADVPEVRRLDLAETVLALAASGVEAREIEGFEAPPAGAVTAARTLLGKLGALSPGGGITELGRRMLRFPVHPRQSRLILEAEARGAGEAGCLVAALIGERDIRGGSTNEKAREVGMSDLLVLRDAFDQAMGPRGVDRDRARTLGLEAGAMAAVERVRNQLVRMLGKRTGGGFAAGDDEPLRMAILAGYPDRVARRRETGPAGALRAGPGDRAPDLALSGGGSARLAPSSVVQDSVLLVAVDAQESRDSGAKTASAGVLVRSASAIEPEWLIDLFPAEVKEVDEARWNAQAERVDSWSRLLYDGLVLSETRGSGDEARVAAVLAEAAIARGVRTFVDDDGLDRLLARMAFVRAAAPDAKIPELGENEARAALTELCTGHRSFAELRGASLLDHLRARLSGEQARALDKLAPDRVTLPGGRAVRLEYEAGKPPWLASRLQDFFGMAAGPTVAAGRVPVVLHLLAPNRRDLQVTTDLAGFWDRHYPAIRKELSRKYPRHAWPENPRTAVPPPPHTGGRRR